MGDSMRAVRVHDWKQAPTVDEIPMPVPGEGETLVRIEAAAVGHLDRTVAGGDFGMKPVLPYVGGVEGCGVVVASDQYAEGTRVMLRGGGLGLQRNGTWAEYVTVSNKGVSELPADLPAELGATYFVPLTTAASALGDIGRLGEWGAPDVESSADEVVLVAGAVGAVGSMVCQLALREGARVIGLVLDADQAARLPEGVEPLLASDTEAQALLTKGRSLSLLVDTLGGADLQTRMAWVRAGGRAVSIGYVTGETAPLDLPNWLLLDVALLPTNMIRRTGGAKALAAELAPLLASGELVLDVQAFDFTDAADALDALGSGRLHGRAVLVPPTH